MNNQSTHYQKAKAAYLTFEYGFLNAEIDLNKPAYINELLTHKLFTDIIH